MYSECRQADFTAHGRTGSQQVLRFLEAWPRDLSDVVENTCGTAILEKCDRYGRCILNGAPLETASPGRYTSHQPRGKSTTDYAFASEGLLPLFGKFHVECPTPDPKKKWGTPRSRKLPKHVLCDSLLQNFQVVVKSMFCTRQQWIRETPQ
jgi:hypothetical protein